MTTGDVNGDGRTDVLAINATDLVWFQAPTWEKHVALKPNHPNDNVAPVTPAEVAQGFNTQVYVKCVLPAAAQQ